MNRIVENAMTNKYSTRYSLRWLLFFTILFSLGCDFRYGFIESNFELGEGSTIPEWIEFKHQPNVVITNVVNRGSSLPLTVVAFPATFTPCQDHYA